MDKNKIQQDIIKELGLENLPDEKKAELLVSMTESILKRITIKILEELPEKDKEEFEKMKETSSPEKIDEFLRAKINNYDKIIEEIVSEFKEEMKTTTEELKNDLAK